LDVVVGQVYGVVGLVRSVASAHTRPTHHPPRLGERRVTYAGNAQILNGGYSVTCMRRNTDDKQTLNNPFSFFFTTWFRAPL
jgi:hypothetical protein